jgi:integrase/recombinase XerD
MLVETAIDEFILSRASRLCSRWTIRSYRQRLYWLARFLEGQGITDLADVGPTDLDRWVLDMSERKTRYAGHPSRPEAAGGLARATVASNIRHARIFFKWCTEREHLDKSPARHLVAPKVDLEAGERAMSKRTLRLLLFLAAHKALAGGSYRDLAMVHFLADTGARVGELVNLRTDRLDVDEGVATVRGKTGKRKVYFTRRTSIALAAWLAERPVVSHRFVFTNQSQNPDRFGGQLTEAGAYQALVRLGKSYGIEGRRNPQSVRHLVGQHFTDQSNLEIARQKLGHKDISTTARFYAHQDRERLRAASDRFSLVSEEN